MKKNSIRMSIVAFGIAASTASLVSMSAVPDSSAPPAVETSSEVVLNSIELAAARAPDAATFETVSYADLNLSHPQGINTLQMRIAAAVNSVCPSVDGRLLRQVRDMQECRAASHDNAMQQVDLLTSQLRVAAH